MTNNNTRPSHSVQRSNEPTVPEHTLETAKQIRPSCIAGLGSYIPSRVVSNKDLSAQLKVSGEWIYATTGIRERRRAEPDQFTSHLAADAAQAAIAQAGIRPGDLQMILLATSTPDFVFPATACLVQTLLGAGRIPAFDIRAAGAGFVYGLQIARHLVGCGTYDSILVIAADTFSSILDPFDVYTNVLLGDAAVAAVVIPGSASRCIVGAYVGAQGEAEPGFALAAGGSRTPACLESVASGMHFVRLDYKATYKAAVRLLSKGVATVLQNHQLTIQQVRKVILHQASRDILQDVSEGVGAAEHQIFSNVAKYGNTSCASVALALEEAAASESIHSGDLVVLASFGAGFTWGSALLRW
jgi:3-oxoacyl-[acyl-carrier-protein] synthase III